eukprot:scaffold156376_cov13-Tisochrysis_lutea.AAC.1
MQGSAQGAEASGAAGDGTGLEQQQQQFGGVQGSTQGAEGAGAAGSGFGMDQQLQQQQQPQLSTEQGGTQGT